MSKPKLWISSPCANGLLYNNYVGSLIHAANRALADGLLEAFNVSFPGKESLIHRGRNTEAMSFLKYGFDKLLTIDADIEFSYEDFKRIISHDMPIVGGCYPLKTFPVVMNFNPLPGRGTELFKSNRGYDWAAWKEFVHKYADPDTGLAEVRHVPTGFMCVRREVFTTLSHTVEHYYSTQPETGKTEEFCNFYPSQVVNKMLESEDWGFSRIASEAGFKLYLDTKIILSHVGYHAFRMGQVYGETDI